MGLLIALTLAPSWFLLALFVPVFGFCMGVRGPIVSSVSARYFAGPRVATIYGVVYASNAVGAALGAFAGGLLHDLTGGFKCIRREVLETIDLDAITSRGYAFQIETTYRALRAGFRVVEVPIRFVDREHGGSKMSHAIVAEGVWKVPLLRLRALTGRL